MNDLIETSSTPNTPECENTEFRWYIHPSNAYGILRKGAHERIHTFPDGSVIDIQISPFGRWNKELQMWNACIIWVHEKMPRWGKAQFWVLTIDGTVMEYAPDMSIKSKTIPMELIRSLVTDTGYKWGIIHRNEIDIEQIRQNVSIHSGQADLWNPILRRHTLMIKNRVQQVLPVRS